MKFTTALRVFVVSGLWMVIGNFVGYKVPPLEALPGMLILLAIVVAGYLLAKVIPIKLPTIAYISLIAIIASIPGVPGSAQVIEYAGKLQFLAICTPILAYAGISIGKDMEAFKKQGIQIIIVSLLAFTGTFVGSAIIADIVLRLTGAI